MADLSYTVQVNGVQDLDKLSNTIDKLHGVLDASKGSGKSLEEIRRIIVGMKGSASVFTDLRDAVRELNTSANSLRTGFQSSLKELTVVIKQTMQESVATMRTAGREQSMALASGIESGTGEVTTAIRRQGKTISAVARQEATKMYEAMVGNNPSAKMTERGMGALLQFKEAGAQLSAYHKEALASWVNNGRLTMAARIKSENDTQNALKAIQAANNKASQIDISGFQAMNRLRLTAAKQAHDDDLAGFKQMNNLRIADHNRTLQALKKANDKAIQDDLAGYRQMLNLKVAAETKAQAEIDQRRGMLGVTPNARAATTALPRAADIDGASRAFKGLGDNMNYAHSMSRGLASGFNLLWLTWGDLAPLFIGAAISNGFMQTAKRGMEVAHVFAIIGNVGGNTAEEVFKLNERMLELANQGPFGPLEIAEAMRTLSLAGLKANEILRVTGDVLNFSVAGTTTIEKAAETLVQVSTAFGMGSQGFAYASDVISKAAADSMTSVEAFSRAMMTASVIGQQYGVSLQDVALGIGTLANLGIQGTAAGTAMRNMYADLSGRSIKVSKILKEQKIEMRNLVDGGFRPMIEVVAELNDKLLKMDPISAKNFMQALMSERGAKGMVEMLRLIRTEAKDMGRGFNNALEEVRAGMEDNAGFAAITAAKMAQTAENQFKNMGSVLQASMQQAYKELEPELVLIFQRMKEVFGSPEFIAGITGIVNAIGNMAKVLVDHGSVLVTVALAYAGLKTAQAATLGVYSLMTAASAALARLTVVETAATAAQTAALAGNTTARLLNNAAQAGSVGGAGQALGMLGLLGRAIPVVNVALGVGTAAWMAYEFWNAKSANTGKEATDNYNNSIVKRLNDESERLERINGMRRVGISLTEAQNILDAEGRKSQFLDGNLKEVEKTRKAYEEAQKAQKAFTTPVEDLTKPAFARNLGAEKRASKEADENVKKAKASFDEAVISAEVAENELKTAEARRRKASQVETGFTLSKMAEDAKATADMFQKMETFTQAGSGSGNDKFQKMFIAFDNEMKMVQQRANDTLAMEKKLAGDQQKILSAKHSAGLLSEGEYQAELLVMTQTSADEQVEAILSGVDAFMAAANKRQAYLDGLAKTAKGPGADRVKTELANLAREVETFTSTSYRSILEVQSTAATAVTTAAVKAQGTLKKLNDSIKEFWRKDEGEQNKARALFEISQQYKFINDSVFSFDVAQKAAMEAGTIAMEKYNTEMERLNIALVEAQVQMTILKAKGFGVGDESFDGFKTLADGLEASIKKMKQRAVEGAAEASTLAFEKARADQVDKFSKDISGSITTALFEGGKQGRKKLRDVIVSELQKPITLFINAVVSSLTGSFTNGMSGGGGVMGGLTKMYDMISGAYNMFSGGGGLAGTAANYISQAGNLFGSTAVGEFAAGMQGLSASAGATGWAGGTWSAAGTQASGAVTSGVVGGGSTTTAASGLGSAAGSALNIAGGVVGGIYGGRMISGGYSVNGGSGNAAVNTGTAIGAAVGSIFPVIGTALGALVGGLLGGVVNRVFGRKLKEVGIEGSFGGTTGFEGSEYKFEKGGWFASDRTTRTPLDEGTRQGLAGQYQYLANTTQDMAKVLGIGAMAVENFSYKIKVNLKGLSDAEIATKLEEEFVKMGNAMASTVLGTDAYSRVNESSMETLTRLSSTLKTVNAAMSNLGGTLYATSLAGANSAQSLVDLFGGLETFASVMSSYYQNFYTEQERTANLTRDLSAAMKTLGLAMPTSREEFRKLVDATLALGVAGQPTLVALMNMQEMFATLYPVIEETSAKAEDLFEKQKENIESLITEVEKLSAARKRSGSLVDKIDEAMGKPTGNYAFEREQELWALAGKGSLEQQVEIAEELTDLVLARMERERESADLQLASAEESKKFWESTLEFVASLTTGNLSPLTTEQKLAAAQDRYYQTYAKAVAGDSEAQGNLQGSASEYLDLARMFYASSQAYTDIFNSVTGGLTQAANNGINSPVGSATGLPGSFQQESYDQLMQLRTISANAYDQLSAQLVTAQNLLSVEYSMLEMQALQLGRADEVKGLLSNLPAEIALALPAFNASVFEQMGYNQARAVESLEAVRAELVLVRETGSQEAHMQAAIYVEAFEKMLIAMQEIVSHSTQANALSNQTLV